MTAVGKILVFLNLVFSLVVGGFVIAMYVARAHWVDAFEKVEKQNTVLAASARSFQSEAETAKRDADAQIAKKNSELQNVQRDREVALNTITELRKELSDERVKNRQGIALTTTYGAEVSKRQEDVAQLRDTLRKRDQEINAIVKKNAELTDQATVAKIEAQTSQDRANRVEKQLQQAYKDMARMRANGGGSTTVARGNGKNPPQEDVEGLVKNTDPSGLMTITIGSDAGLTKGHTLELFRINTSSPSQSRYLGTVRVLEAEAHQAVVQPAGRLAAPAQPGDRVASRILAGQS